MYPQYIEDGEELDEHYCDNGGHYHPECAPDGRDLYDSYRERGSMFKVGDKVKIKNTAPVCANKEGVITTIYSCSSSYPFWVLGVNITSSFKRGVAFRGEELTLIEETEEDIRLAAVEANHTYLRMRIESLEKGLAVAEAKLETMQKPVIKIIVDGPCDYEPPKK